MYLYVLNCVNIGDTLNCLCLMIHMCLQYSRLGRKKYCQLFAQTLDNNMSRICHCEHIAHIYNFISGNLLNYICEYLFFVIIPS